MNEYEISELTKEEVEYIVDLLKEFSIQDKKIKLMMPIIENTCFMKIKLEEARKLIKTSSVAVPYDNGGGQKGIRENPLFKGYESLWKSYMSGMGNILSLLPSEAVRVDVESEVIKPQTMLEVVRGRHGKVG